MKKILAFVTLAGLAIVIAVSLLAPVDTPQPFMTELRERMKASPASSVDHSQFAELQGSFNRPRDVTAACITCHNHRHTEVMRSNHWNWEREEYIPGRGVVYIGKKNAMNNFCIGALGNEASCAKCHIGLGMTEAGFSYTDAGNIDCLVCHDQTQSYVKATGMGGAPVATLDFGEIARNVGKPDRSNCGVCHFYGGGGNNVKHGDLEEALFQPLRDVDVHMGIDGMDMSCVDCHVTEQHNMAGKLYSLSSMNRNRVTCEQCHGALPHTKGILNEHTLKVACQTCHIPVYAKVNATKTHWDWSTVGQLRDGKAFELDDEEGNNTYLSSKGSFAWGRQLQPEYVWFNGTASHYLLGDVFEDSSATISLNTLHGSYADRDAKIIPVKVHRAIQPADPVNRMLIMPKLHGEQQGEGALWTDFDWKRAAEIGMEHAGLPFSGEVAFVKTDMYWPINHMVSAKEASVQCVECHTRDNGRLAGLNDFYMPGRDYSRVVQTGGSILLLLTLLGVAVHGGARILTARTKKAGATR
jgi:octaheme c-type cytochrome (tetrathionate reductase family)